jgi:hypothetical protein
VIPRETDEVEVDVTYTASASATKATYAGSAIFIEDPDISSGTEAPLDGSTPLDGTAQVSGQWNPQRNQNTTKSPVAVLIPEGVVDRQVRIYLVPFGPNSTPQIVRANDTTQTPSPSVVVTIPAVSDTYTSSKEKAWLVTDPSVTVNSLFNLAPPKYTLTFTYTPPTPEEESHRPPGIAPFGGVVIWYEHFDTGERIQAMGQPYVATSPQVPQAAPWTSTQYDVGSSGFRVYFVSMDTGGNQNSIVPGITPSVDITVDANIGAPKVTHFQIVPGTDGVQYQPDGSYNEQATFSWTLPTADAGLARYAGMFLYRMATTGTAPVPVSFWHQTSATDQQTTPTIPNMPSSQEIWTVAAISVDFNGQLGDDPKTWGGPGWTSPVVAWTVGPPGIGVIGGGQEYAPLVTINAGATVVPAESTSSDGVRMVTFAINGTNGAWSPPVPPDNRFGGVSVALVINGDLSHPIIWQVPQGDNKFTTPAITAPGSFGQPIRLDFYLLSRDPQGHRNQLVVTKTPFITYTYTPTEGVIIPSRNPLTPQWFSSEFFWLNNALTVDSIGAGKIQVGSLLQVGGKNSFSTTSQAGQIGVYDSNSKMVAWIGVAQVATGQQPQNTVGANNYGGGWFGQLWVGGDSPAHAPLWIDTNGVVTVGGIAALAGAPYPYISIRDDYGNEKGRIGAKLTNPAPPGDNGAVPSGSLPTELTSGAWFTQFAAGGLASNHWQVLIDGSQTPGKFYIRDTDQFSIDFAQNFSTPPFNNEYKILMGKSIWAGVGSLNNTWQFPGIQIYEASGSPPNQIFGSILLNRGLMLRGTSSQNYGIIVTLAMVNGDSNGSDTPANFWGQLAMYNPLNPTQISVDIASGHAVGNAVYGDSHLYLSNSAGNYTFTVDENGQVHFRDLLFHGWGSTAKQLTDSNGNWIGGISGGVVTSIVQGPGLLISPTTGTGAVTITNNGVTSVSGTGGVSVSGTTGAVGVSLNSSYAATFTGLTVNAPGNITFAGVCTSNGGAGAGFNVTGDNANNSIQTIGGVSADQGYYMNQGTKQLIDYRGAFVSAGGVGCSTAGVGGASLAVYYAGAWVYGAPLSNQTTFRTADNRTVTVTGGLITSIVP